MRTELVDRPPSTGRCSSAAAHVAGTILHSDRGSQYTAHDMAKACSRHGLRRSMGATGICWDNAGSESLWSTFKHEHYYRHTFTTKLEFIAAVDNWMQFYNHRQATSAIGMLSPIDYEQSLKRRHGSKLTVSTFSGEPQIEGVTIPAGRKTPLPYASANRDPRHP